MRDLIQRFRIWRGMWIETMFKLAKAKVWHKRFKPKANEFSYNVFYICFSLNEIEKLKDVLQVNKFGMLGFYDKDHGERDGSSLKNWIYGILNKNQIEADDVILLTYPRVFGYVFNPVSFWYCLKDRKLMAVLAEVNNTFGESHDYLVYNPDKSPIQPEDKLVAQKHFHVSPFCKVEGEYIFSFAIDENRCSARILHNDAEGKLLDTTVNCRLEELTKTSLRRELKRSPVMTLMVIGLIHWQALKLFIKKVKYNVKPAKKDFDFSTTHDKKQ